MNSFMTEAVVSKRSSVSVLPMCRCPMMAAISSDLALISCSFILCTSVLLSEAHGMALAYLFFLGVSGSGLSFLGRPLPGTLRMASKADLSYKASFVRGFIPALNNRMFTVLTGTSNSSAISPIVYPSIFISSDYINQILKNIVGKLHLLNICLAKLRKKFEKSSGKITNFIDIKLFMYYIYT
jgi:hypothetical protein